MESADIMLVKLVNAGMNFNSLRELILNVVRNTMKKVGYYYEEDLAQDIFMKLFDKIERFDEQKGSIKSWVAQITKHAVIDHLRKQRKITNNRVIIDDEMYIQDDSNDYLYKEELFQILDEELIYLSNREQALLKAKYLESKSGRDIADIFDINEKHVPMHIKRAKDKLINRVNVAMAA